MTLVVILMLLIVGITADPPSKISNQDESGSFQDEKRNPLPLTLEVNNDSGILGQTNSGCVFPFERIGQNCYFFSEDQLNFDDSILYCESLANGHSFDSSLAILDYDEIEDQSLLDAVTLRNKPFWVGGKFGTHWSWLDNRDIYLQAPFWYYGEPNTASNKCTVVDVSTNGNNIRSYLYDYNCASSVNFICQTGYFQFRLLDDHFYFFSEDVGLPHTSWQNARDYCNSLSVPMGYHSDLAVLDRPDQDSYHLMNSFVTNGNGRTWLGAFAETDCNYNWVDGRSLPLSSQYWYQADPKCGHDNQPVNLGYNPVENRTFLQDLFYETASYPFVCQMFKN